MLIIKRLVIMCLVDRIGVEQVMKSIAVWCNLLQQVNFDQIVEQMTNFGNRAVRGRGRGRNTEFRAWVQA